MPPRQSLAANLFPRSVALFFVAVVVCLGTQSASQSQKALGKAKPACQLTPDDYDVYAALAEALGVPEHPEDGSKRKQILIADMTAAPRDVRSHFGTWGYRSESKAAPGHDTVADFELKAQSSCLLNPQFVDGQSYKVITRGELDKVFRRGGWQDFYKEYPDAGGYWIFSRAGFNSARNEAVLSVSHWCGELCGAGHLYLLAKQNGRWKVQNQLMLWVS